MLLVAENIMQLRSPAFAYNGLIPVAYTCDGENINPELHVAGIPNGTKSLALLVEDCTAPAQTFDHWVMWNIPPRERIAKNSSPGAQGRNSLHENKYYGPCPASGIHRYRFTLYALDTLLELPFNTTKDDLHRAMQGHILACSELTGLYKRT